MKVKTWLGTSVVLLMAVAATLVLFYYWETERSASWQALQNRVNEIELDRVVERGGQRLYKQTEEMVKRIDKIILSYQTAAEGVADTGLFQTVNKVKEKREELQNLLKKNSWYEAIVTDDEGKILTRVGGSLSLKPVIDKKIFKFVKVQRVTTINASTYFKEATLDMMIPCISNKSSFVGVLNVSVKLSSDEIKTASALHNGTVLVGDKTGKIMLSTNQTITPETLEQLIGKQSKKVSTLLVPDGPKYFRARWKGQNYILASASLAEDKLALFSLVPASGFEKAFATQSDMNKVFSNPIIMGGYAIIIVAGLLLLMIFSRGENLGSLNHQLEEKVLGETGIEPLSIKAKGQYGKLIDYINILIDRVINQHENIYGDSDAAAELKLKYKETLNQAYEEIDSLRAQLDQTQMQQISSGESQGEQVKSLQQQVKTLEKKNESLLKSLDSAEQAAAAASAAAAAATAAAESVPLPPLPTTDSASISKEEIEMMEIIKQSGKLRTEAITNMSEDLKATLMVIKNYISSILSSEEGKITDSQQEFLGVVINKSARLERHINDLLDISHMESEGTEWYTTPTDLVAMLQDVVLNIQPQADTKQIKVQPEIQAHLPLVKLNSDRIGQVFINLAQHALKITPFGSVIKIIASETTDDIVVKIQDGGTPLTEEQAKYVFSTYHNENTSAGSDYSSTGLRFAIISEIVELHHGKISMHRLSNQGNEAIIQLPKKYVLTEEELPSAGISFSAVGLEVSAPRTDDENNNSLEVYEVKAIDDDKNQRAYSEKSETSPYDLSAFIGKLDTAAENKKPQIPSGAEDLDELLKDIEDIDGQMES